MLTDVVKRYCPYCGEPITLVIDCSAGDQSYIEDCEVCCRPMEVAVVVGGQGLESVELSAENT